MWQPYTEQPEDVFDPQEDWQEVMTQDASPSETHLSNDSQTATIVGYIPWNKQRSCAAYFLQTATVNGNGYLSRNNPPGHPIFPQLFASEIGFKPFVPAPNPAAPNNWCQAESPFWNPEFAINIATTRKVIATVAYRAFRYSFLDDSQITDPRDEVFRNVYWDIEPSVEALSADGIAQLVFAETGYPSGGPTAGVSPFPAPLAELLGKAAVTLNWMNVPYNYLSVSDDYFWPQNIIDCLGKVNSTNFPINADEPFEPGTLLFDSVKFVQKVMPLAAADPTYPLISIDVAMCMKFFDPDTGAQYPLAQGHNLMPWRGATTDPTGGKFFYATRGGKPSDLPLLAEEDFNQMFVNPN